MTRKRLSVFHWADTLLQKCNSISAIETTPTIQRSSRFLRPTTSRTLVPPPDAFAALGYDTARLLLTAIRNAGSSDPDRVRSALASIREFDRVTGQMGFQAGSQIPLKSVTILGVDGGTLQLVEQAMPVRTPAP